MTDRSCKTPLLTRRHLLQAAGTALASAPLQALASPLVLLASQDQATQGARVYAVRRSTDGAADGIVFHEWSDGQWQVRQFVPMAGVRHVLVDVSQSRLFAALEASDTGLPAGQVAMLHIQKSSGLLSPGRAQHLALAARKPLAIVTALDHQMLIVAAEGGVFSLLPVSASGDLQPVISACKDLFLHRRNSAGLALRWQTDRCLQAQAGGCVRHYAYDGTQLQRI